MMPKGIRLCIVNAIFRKHVKEPAENCSVCLLPEFEKLYKYSDTITTKEHIFEGKMFSIPRGYDAVLRTKYGDYMKLPPEEKRGGHDLALGEIINDSKKDYREYQTELRNAKKQSSSASN